MKSKSSRSKDPKTQGKQQENIVFGKSQHKNTGENGAPKGSPLFVFIIFNPSFLLYAAVKLF